MLTDQSFQFVQQFFESLHRRLDGGSGAHVYPGQLQQFQRIIAAAGFQELDIVVRSRLPFLQDLLGDRGGGGIAGGIFIDVERAVEAQAERLLLARRQS